jgi:LysM repeat protein
VAVLTSACADEDLESAKADAPRSITVSGIGANAPSVKGTSVTASSTRVNLSPRQPGPDALPMFYRMQVRPGDTVASVAERFGLRPEYVIWNNESALRDGELIEGAILDIPSANGILHRPQPGETLADIAARYGVEERVILDFPANASIAAAPTAGTTILVPDARRP